MKTNVALHNKIGFQSPSEKVWYAAHVLKAALSNSPAILISAAIPAIAARPAIIAQTAKPARAATAAVTAMNNVGFGFGELYLNSPAYQINTPIPAISAKPASAAVMGVPAIAAVSASPAISSPAIVAISGWSDAITITKSSADNTLTVVAELPVYQGVGIVGSQKLVIGEVTPNGLQAPSFVDNPVYALGQSSECLDNPLDTTLEQVLWRNALLCNHTIESTNKTINGAVVSCKKITVTLYAASSYVFSGDQLQLTSVRVTANTGS